MSTLDGSAAALKLTETELPSLIGPPLPRLAVGATLSTVTVKLSLLAPPSSSVTVKVTA